MNEIGALYSWRGARSVLLRGMGQGGVMYSGSGQAGPVSSIVRGRAEALYRRGGLSWAGAGAAYRGRQRQGCPC